MPHAKLFERTLLDEDSPRASPPPSFQGELHSSQAAVLHRMLQLEATQLLSVVDEYDNPKALSFNAAVLSTPFASGKTVDILALIAYDIPPRKTLPHLLTPGYDSSSDVSSVNRALHNVSRSASRQAEFGASVNMPGILLEWVPTRHIPSTLVVAATSVISHWEETIRTFVPHLTYFIIDGVERLRAYLGLVAAGRHVDYHLVLLKTGTVVTKLPGSSSTIQTLTALCRHLPAYVWDRLVIDDYDTIVLPRAAHLPAAFFTWYVSATRRSLPTRTPGLKLGWEITRPEAVGDAVFRMLAGGGWPAINAVHDMLLATTLAVRCVDRFHNANVKLPAPTVTDYILKAPPMLALFNGVNMPAAAQEALNSGAVHAAAEILGFSCNTLAELAGRVLSKHKETYEKARRELAALDYFEAMLARAAPEATELTTSQAGALLTAIRKGWLAGEPLPAEIDTGRRAGENYAALAREFREARETQIATHSRAIERLRENAAEGECQVCLLPWAELAAGGKKYVANCCQTMVCGTCISTTANGGKNQFVDECPNCFAKLFGDDGPRIIAMNADIELEELTPDLLDAAGPAAAPPTPACGAAEGIAERITRVWKAFASDPKIRALLQLVAGLPLEEVDVRPGSRVPGLLGNDGAVVPLAPDAPRRVLIFSQHTESTRRIKEALKGCGLPCAVLGGVGRGQRLMKDRAITAFRTSQEPLEVLIITASKDCPGIHLPECTDQIFFHRNGSPEVAAQLAGRGQRYGRTASMRIHNLLYVYE